MVPVIFFPLPSYIFHLVLSSLSFQTLNHTPDYLQQQETVYGCVLPFLFLLMNDFRSRFPLKIYISVLPEKVTSLVHFWNCFLHWHAVIGSKPLGNSLMFCGCSVLQKMCQVLSCGLYYRVGASHELSQLCSFDSLSAKTRVYSQHLIKLRNHSNVDLLVAKEGRKQLHRFRWNSDCDRPNDSNKS